MVQNFLDLQTGIGIGFGEGTARRGCCRDFVAGLGLSVSGLGVEGLELWDRLSESQWTWD